MAKFGNGKKSADITFAAADPFDGNALYGSNDPDNPDTLIGNSADNFIYSLQGVDTLTGGAGADVFNFASYADSGVLGGIDTITDFSNTEGDKIDLSHLTHYASADSGDLSALWRDVEFGDVTLTPIAGGTNVHVEIVAGYPANDVDIVVLGEALTVDSFIF